MMKIAVIGTGYVGLVTAACLAQMGHEVVGVDIDKQKIEKLAALEMPIFEPGLQELVRKNYPKRLNFTLDLATAVGRSEVVFVAVGTPSLPDGSADLQYVRQAAESIGRAMNGYKVIVNKSTVPIGTGDIVRKTISNFYQGEFEVVSNPEFLREGQAVADFMNPDRIVIGNGEGRAREIMLQLYSPLPGERVLTNVKTAEMIKYASNSLLATEISFINSIANICEKVGADVTEVARGMRLDKRIGQKAFLDAGVGYGGSCFPKDVKALIRIANENGVSFSILETVESTNQAQKESLLPKIQKLLGEDLAGKKIAVWGLAFKPGTDDVREAPSQTVIQQLRDRGAEVVVYDPVVAKEVGLDESIEDADCLVILTEWEEFKKVDLGKVKKLMKEPNVVDGRNLYRVEEMKKLGFNYLSVGR